MSGEQIILWAIVGVSITHSALVAIICFVGAWVIRADTRKRREWLDVLRRER